MLIYIFQCLCPWQGRGVIKSITKPFGLYWMHVSSRPNQKWSLHNTQGSIPYSFSMDKTWYLVNRKGTLYINKYTIWSLVKFHFVFVNSSNVIYNLILFSSGFVQFNKGNKTISVFSYFLSIRHRFISMFLLYTS